MRRRDHRLAGAHLGGRGAELERKKLDVETATDAQRCLKAAVGLGLNPRTFIVAVTYAASFSFITPLEPACVLVYTPGRYRFMDFVKIGTILTIIVFAAAMFFVPIFWPL